MSNDQPEAPVAVGGQAVVEGVMMRAPAATSVAVRRPDGSIVVRVRAAKRIAARYPFLGRPALRGITVMIETLMDGMSALNFSAEQALPEEEKPKSEGATQGAIFATLVFAVALGFGVFAVLPHALTWLLGWALGSEDLSGGRALVFHLVDGVFKLLIFLGYVWGISRMKEMRRVFEYHGAEHQAVHAFEAKLPLTVESLGRFPTAHPRCGTAFLVTVIAVSILFFACIFPLMPVLSDTNWLNQLAYVFIKLPLILPIAGVSYELIRLAGKTRDGLFGRILSAPGVWFQRITTQPPDPSQQEIAIVALASALEPSRAGVGDALAETVVTFGTFDEFRAWTGAAEPTGAS